MSNTTSITLEFPVMIAGAKVGVLTMRRANVGDVLKANRNKDEIEREINLFADLCEVSPDSIRSLDLKDYSQLQEVFRGFTS